MNNEFFDKVSEQISKYRPKNLSELEPIKESESSYKLLLDFYNGDIYDVEHFVVLYLNKANKPIMIKKISSGGMTGTVVDVKVILRYAIICKAQAIILSHNHPSSSLIPSTEDKAITKKIKEACTTLDISVLDHIIIADDKYYSFSDEGLI